MPSDFAVDKNGDVCISILHEPGEDKYGYEKPEERWLPIHTVETIMISVISMLADPNGDSPANVDAAVRSPAPASLPVRSTGSQLRHLRARVRVCVCARACVCRSVCRHLFFSSVSTKISYRHAEVYLVSTPACVLYE